MTDYKKLNLIATSSPHIRGSETTRSIMLDVIIAMIPALVFACFNFGIRALGLTAVSVVGCVFFEWAYRKLMKKDSTIHDLSACVTGVLMVFCMPSSVPLWMIVWAALFAIVLVKQLFGGIGKNFLNPALAGRALMLAGFPALMTTYVVPTSMAGVDAATMATPLGSLYDGAATSYSLMDLFIGRVPGCMGEISALALLIGGAYLLYRGVITWRIPGTFIGTVAILTLLFGGEGYGHVEWMLCQLVSGGLMLGAIFMATDYTTSPITRRGQLIFGIGCGAITVLIRYFGTYPEGVSYAILVMNLFVPLIERYTIPRKFGAPAKVKKEKGGVKVEK